jgi:hypothetical protein
MKRVWLARRPWALAQGLEPVKTPTGTQTPKQPKRRLRLKPQRPVRRWRPPLLARHPALR